MTLAPPKIAKAAWHLLPGSLRRRLRTNTGKRFMRFVPVSLAAVAASQTTLAVLVGITRLSAGTSAVLASIAGAAVSYILSRWAWERKGRPHVLKETLPFWAVAISAWIVLGVTSHYASVWATSHGLSHWERVAVVNAAYLMANCVTFVTRFAIFHYVLFADRRSRGFAARRPNPSSLPDVDAEPVPVPVTRGGADRPVRR
jgi:putative flippase GtrA